MFNNEKLLERIVIEDVGGEVDRISNIIEYSDRVIECCEEKLILTFVFRIVSWKRVVGEKLLLVFLEDIVISLE